MTCGDFFHLLNNFDLQGREEMHSELESCIKSLMQMGYTTFMTFVTVFFALTNLKNIANA